MVRCGVAHTMILSPTALRPLPLSTSIRTTVFHAVIIMQVVPYSLPFNYRPFFTTRFIALQFSFRFLPALVYPAHLPQHSLRHCLLYAGSVSSSFQRYFTRRSLQQTLQTSVTLYARSNSQPVPRTVPRVHRGQ